MSVIDVVADKYQVRRVNPSQLVISPQQPNTRGTAAGPLNQLKNSIQKVGLQYPPLVLAKPNNRYQIIDGHRRVAVMRDLGWELIPVIVTEGNSDELFAAVSGNVAKMKSFEWAAVHLAGGAVPSGPIKVCITKLEQTMGREFLEQLTKKRTSPGIWNVANRVIRYLSLDEAERKRVLAWLAEIGTQNVAAYMTGGNQPAELMRAFKEKREPMVGGQ